jgi:hypothetical protein
MTEKEMGDDLMDWSLGGDFPDFGLLPEDASQKILVVVRK